MFNSKSPFELQQHLGEAAKDRGHCATEIILQDALGMCSLSLVFTHTNYIDTVPLLPMYFSQKMHLPWKCWVDVAAKEKLCIIDWINGVLPPGSDFNIKKLGASEIHEITGSYVDSILNGNIDYKVFSVICWSTGVWFYCCHNILYSIDIFIRAVCSS
jgi:hypothetical protein